MTNMIQEAKNQAAALAMAAYCAAAADGTLPKAEVKEAPVEIPGTRATAISPPLLHSRRPRLCGNRPVRLPRPFWTT